MLINRKNTNKLLYIFLTIHLILWTLIPTLTNNNLPLDTIEHLAWGSNLDWGFNKHPPAVAFFLEIFYQIFGSQDWVYYLLSQIFVVIAFIFVFKFADDLFKNKTLSLVSVLLLEGIYFYNFTTPEFNVNVCQLPFWSLCVYYSWKLFDKQQITFKDCFLLGVFAAVGFLSKYLFIYLLIAINLLFFYVIFIKRYKKFDFKFLVSLEVFFVLLVPHLVWLTSNNYITITYGLARTGLENSSFLDHVIYPLIFLGKQLGLLIPFGIMSFFLINKFKFKISLKDNKLLFLIFINLVPIGLMLLTSILIGSKIRTMWMTPFYLFIGVLVVYIFQKQINLKKLNGFISVFLILFIFSPFAYAYISLTETDKRTDYPGKEIAIKTQYVWSQDHKEPINVVLGDEWYAGNLSYHLRSRPTWEGPITKDKLNLLSKFTCIDNICVGNR
ncbi:dolichyl-phosphate-mannose-protein mannosyltransferase [Candidatus Pelagibacter ubique]|uniref:Dolichyl-phosphate-mannose-protein mannosyltransferase n=1 Tax=Pelagibacter ubique TaxID=198252 RepID=A0ABX1SYR9_PELUQ|nr:glycosyltransferase family 39 protein [Candidatus Pelagibacter ubique]NMN66985.1 dolichyl-phosphate-mannose-protein mannosyltransferase [Candidatus Pelagibacter ubique]